jgi:hypothetical protein
MLTRSLAGAAILLGLGFSLAPTQAHAQVAVECTNCENEITAIVNEAETFGQMVKDYALQLKTYIGDEFSWATQASQYALQIQQYANEIQMFINWVHMPTLGGALGLLNFAGLGTLLPVNPMALLGVVNGLSSMSTGNLSFGGIEALAGTLSGALAGFASQAWAVNHIYTTVDGTWDSQQINAGAASIAGTQGLAAATNLSLQQHLAAQPALRDHLMGASSPKDVQDATAEIDLETTWELNQIGQMQTAQLMYLAQQDSRQQRDLEGSTQSIDMFISACGCGL